MDVQCAVITAAGPQQSRLPLQRFVDLSGEEKTALQIIVDEVTAAGVEQVCVVVRPGDQAAYIEAAGEDARLLTFVEQPEPRGYGEALTRAAEFVGNRPFLHLVSDHLYVSGEPRRCAQQLVQAAREQNCAVSAVQATRENMLPYYGAVGGRLMAGQKNLYEIETVLEKPTPTQAEQTLLVPGLRAGHYLCLFGMHVLTPDFFGVLRGCLDTAGDAPLSLSPALSQLARCERYLALTVNGSRYNTGVKYGLLMAQVALALHGVDREEILARLVEMLAK
jgi:UTP--glucose-1-phosphate uridylyltransferase